MTRMTMRRWKRTARTKEADTEEAAGEAAGMELDREEMEMVRALVLKKKEEQEEEKEEEEEEEEKEQEEMEDAAGQSQG